MTDTPPDYPPELVERVAYAMWLDECDRLHVPQSQWAWEKTASEWFKRARAALDASGLREAQQEVERLNKWADGFSDAQLKERRLCEEHIREVKAERDALKQRDELVEALEFVRDEGMLGSHSAHWDRTDGGGSGCPACEANRKARERISAALARARGEP